MPSVQPARFMPASVRPVAQAGEVVAASVNRHIREQLETLNYDRIGFVAAFSDHLRGLRSTRPHATVMEAFATFRVEAGELIEHILGGHCASLAQDLLERCSDGFGSSGYLVASVPPKSTRQRGGPEYGHAAAVIPFVDPHDATDRGFVLMDPGFGFPESVVIRENRITPVARAPEIWDFSLVGDRIRCQPRAPNEAAGAAPTKKFIDKVMIYRTDVLTNPDESITVPLMAVDRIPPILSHDEHGSFVASLVVNYTKSEVHVNVSGNRWKIAFGDINDDPEGGWLGDAENVAVALRLDKAILLERIQDAVKMAPVMNELRTALGGD